MTTSAFPALSTAEQIFKDVVWDPMLKLGETWVEAEVPFLALPVIKQIDEATLQIVTDAVFNQFRLLVDLSAIQLVGSERQAAYDSAFESLTVVLDEKGRGSPEYVAAQAKALAAMSQFTHVGG